MSVHQNFGFDSAFQQEIADAWPGWVRQRPLLGEVTDPHRLRGWLQAAGPERADEVVHALVSLGSIHGADDPTAALVVAWLLMPGAAFTAWQLQSVSDDVDQVVAGELWILVRRFPLHRRKVVINLMRDLRNRVFEACEVPSALRRLDPTWFVTLPSGDSVALRSVPFEREASPLEELVDVLDWACDRELIGAEDRRLVLLVMEASEDLGHIKGLLSNVATARVAEQLGVCNRTVRRRVQATIATLAAAAASYSRAA